MCGMILASGVRLQPMPSGDSERVLHLFVALTALVLAVVFLLFAFRLFSHVADRMTTTYDAVGIPHSHWGSANNFVRFILSLMVFGLSLFSGALSLRAFDPSVPVSPAERQAAETNVRTVQDHYGLRRLKGWCGSSDDGVWDVTYMPEEDGTPAPDGYTLKRTGDGDRLLVKEKPRKARLLVQNRTVTLHDRETGKELG